MKVQNLELGLLSNCITATIGSVRIHLEELLPKKILFYFLAMDNLILLWKKLFCQYRRTGHEYMCSS